MKLIPIYGLLLGAMASLMLSCKKTEPNPDPDPELTQRNRAVIEYMIADNNLYSYALEDINEMESAWDDGYDGYMVVFLYPVASTSSYASATDHDETPRLLLIQSDEDSRTIRSTTLKSYSRDEDPTDPAFMGQVIADAMELVPASRYALAFWSHGSGWLPDGTSQPLRSTLPAADDPAWAGSKLAGIIPETDSPILSYSFGQSNSHGNSEMEIDAMAAALPAGIQFDFILFDACHMGCVELAWELKDHTQYLIASVAETLADGFPYTQLMGSMFSSTADVTSKGRLFYEHYSRLSGSMQSATVGVVRTDRLPALASSVKALCEAGLPGSGISYAGQQFGRRPMGFGDTFYDLEDFVHQTWGTTDPLVTAFETALNEAVEYQAATPWLFRNESGAIQVKTHCGLSCYLPRTTTPLSLEAYRTRFGWSTASGMGSLLGEE